MRNLSVWIIIVAVIIALIGGILRLCSAEFIAASRVWAGVAAILLLTSIGINTLPKKE